MSKYKYVWGIKCSACGDRIWSSHVHDFRYCECESTYVDGGRYYIRSGWDPTIEPPVQQRIRVSLEEWLASDRNPEYKRRDTFPY